MAEAGIINHEINSPREKAELVSNALKHFAGLDDLEEIGNNQVSMLFDVINKYGTADVIRLMVENRAAEQAELGHAINTVNKIPIEVVTTDSEGFALEKEQINPWTGAATAVMLDETGAVLAAVSNPPVEAILLEQYGSKDFDFLQFALRKSVAGLVMDKLGLQGDMAQHWPLLKKLGYKGHEGLGQTFINGKMVYIGTSGCEATSDGVALITNPIRGGLKYMGVSHARTEKKNHFAAAGLMDSIYADNLSEAFRLGPNSEVTSFPLSQRMNRIASQIKANG